MSTSSQIPTKGRIGSGLWQTVKGILFKGSAPSEPGTTTQTKYGVFPWVFNWSGFGWIGVKIKYMTLSSPVTPTLSLSSLVTPTVSLTSGVTATLSLNSLVGVD